MLVLLHKIDFWAIRLEGSFKGRSRDTNSISLEQLIIRIEKGVVSPLASTQPCLLGGLSLFSYEMGRDRLLF